MTTDTDRRIKQIMGEILDIDPDAIDGGTTHETVSSWDSQNHLNLVFALEQEFDATFEVAEVETMTSFSAIQAAVARYTG